MLDSLNAMGVNTILISQPYVNKNGAIDNYNLLSSKGMLARDSEGNTHDVSTWVGDAGMLDISNPDTREWLWNRLKPLTAEGLAGWWGDLGEPEVHPLTIMHANGQTASQYHNVYGNEWSRLIYEGMRKDFPTFARCFSCAAAQPGCNGIRCSRGQRMSRGHGAVCSRR